MDEGSLHLEGRESLKLCSRKDVANVLSVDHRRCNVEEKIEEYHTLGGYLCGLSLVVSPQPSLLH